MMRAKPLLTLLSLWTALALTVACSSSDPQIKDDTTTTKSAASDTCREATQQCRANCEEQAKGDLAARGPCLNNCMKKAHDCHETAKAQ